MQEGTLRDPYDSDEGFLREERLDMRLAESKRALQEVTFELPEAKELINIGRPLQMRPRCLYQDDLAELPHYLSVTVHQEKKQAESRTRTQPRKGSLSDYVGNADTLPSFTIPNSSSNKRSYNGRGKTLFDFFEADESFEPVFRRTIDERSRPDIIYDYTANNKILELSNDYDPKLYRQLNPKLRELEPSYSDELAFDSNFECGNLRQVYRQRSSPSNFYCLLLNDSNTHGYTQWFCFRVRNTIKGTYTFHIMNQIKNTSMYRQGMKVSIFSEKQWHQEKRSWFKGGDEISYSNTRIERTTKENESYFCLAFSYTFSDDNDTVYFALNQPYSYSRFIRFVETIEPKLRTNRISLTKKTIGYTLANNLITSLVIDEQNTLSCTKQVILIMARQHPGETVGSFVAEGLVEALSQPTPESQFLIKRFRFIVLPMVNPDGVIYGHSRCNLAGFDLNRQWGPDLVKQLTPETHCIKKYIQNVHDEHGVEMMIDLHGHSKKMNSFFYACRKESRCAMRLLSYAMSKFTDNFDVYSCTYGLAKDKANTVRSQLFSLGINAYTLENSYFGRERNGRKEHYSQSDLKAIGVSLLRSMFVLYADREAVDSYELSKEMLMEQLEANIDRIEIEENKNKNDSGSESDPDGDLLALEQRVKTMKLRDPTKKSKLIKSIGGNIKKKRFMSVVYRNKIAKEEAQEEQKERKRKTKVDRNLQIKQIVSQELPNKTVAPPQRKRKSTSRNSIILTKKFERPFRTQTESFKLSSSKPPRLRIKQINHTTEQNSKEFTRTSLPSRQLFEHPSRKKALVRQPMKFVKTEQSDEGLEKQLSVQRIETHSKRQAERFMTELDAFRIRLNREQLLRSCDLLSKQQSLDETQFMKIESLYRSKREVPQPSKAPQPQSQSPPIHLSRKVSRSKKKFKVTLVDPTATSKFRKFESFIAETETHAQILSKNRAISFGDQNSVFYHFPLL